MVNTEKSKRRVSHIFWTVFAEVDGSVAKILTGIHK